MTCPTIRCGKLEDGTCAVINGNEITIGNCEGDLLCNLADIMPAYNQGKQSVKCSIRSRKLYQISEQRVRQIKANLCGKANSDLELADQDEAPIRCDNNDDCKLINGNSWYCECGFDGNSYCLPAPNDNKLRKLYNSTCNEEIDEFMKNSFEISLFPYNVNLDPCTANQFSDVAVLEALKSGEKKFKTWDNSNDIILSILSGMLAFIFYS